jgi:ribosomal protein S18 acetylase RimI-like enzyme
MLDTHETGFDLRLARLADAAEIAAISRDYIELELPWRWRPAKITEALESGHCVGVVADRGAFLAGFALMRLGYSSSHLLLMAVRPKFRSQGLARRMLSWLERCSITAGCFRVSLEVREDNEAGHRFYRHNGFRIVDHIEGYYYGQTSALRMAKTLAEEPIDDNSGWQVGYEFLST